MLRIGVIMYQTSPSKGQELVAQRMVKSFRAEGYDAFLITSPLQDGQPVVSEEEIAKHGGYVHLFDEKLGIPVIRVGTVPVSWPPRRVSLADFVGTLGQIVDAMKLNVLIVHSTLWNGPEDVLKFVEWRRNLARDGFPQLTPIFCHMSHFQDASPDRYDIVERSYREAWNNTSLSQIVKEADLLLVVSPYEKQVMKELGATEEKCFLFPGGIEEMTEADGDVRRFLERYAIPPSATIVTSLGTVEERKNTMAVVEVAKRLAARRDIHFVIAGFEQGDYGRKVRTEASGASNVSVLGPISDSEKAALVKATAINLIMSRSEALGITQLEFMSNGVPVVSSGTGGQQWIVKDRESGILVKGPDDLEGAAAAVAKLADNVSLRRKLGANAGKRAAQYSMGRLIHSLSKRLEQLAEQRLEQERERKGLPEEDQVLEAMVSGGMRVIITNRRLLVKDEAGRRSSSVFIEDIERVTRKTNYPWSVVILGAVGAGILLLSAIGNWPQALLGDLFGSPGQLQLFEYLLPIVPVAVAVPLFLHYVRRGYSVQARGAKIFLPREFLRLLKLVDRLVPNELLDGED